MRPLVLAIDIGSSALRASIFSSKGRLVGKLSTEMPYDTRTLPDGGVEIDPDHLLERLGEAIDGTLKRTGKQQEGIAGVGMSALASTLIGLDNAGKTTTPMYTWADTRPVAEADDLRRILNEAEVHERTGCPIHTSYLPVRLLWLKRTNPEGCARTVRWVSLGNWLQLSFFGRMEQSFSIASWGGLLNRHTLDWDDDLLRVLDLSRASLPPLVDVGHALSGLRDPYAQRWPSLREVPWYPAIGDGAANNIGIGCLTPEEVVVHVGTSAACRALVPGTVEVIPDGLWCYRLDQDTSLLGGALSEGGNVFNWLQQLFGVKDLRALEKKAAQMEPDSHGLTLLPFLAGERSPGWDNSARAAIYGMRLGTGPVELLRAAQEAVAYRIVLVCERLSAALPPSPRIVASGGALLKTQGWPQMVADVLGRPITASGESQSSARGAALLALRSLGIMDDLAEVPSRLGTTYTPDWEHHTIYRRAMERQHSLYDALRNWRADTNS